MFMKTAQTRSFNRLYSITLLLLLFTATACRDQAKQPPQASPTLQATAAPTDTAEKGSPRTLTCSKLTTSQSWWEETLERRIEEYKYMHPNTEVLIHIASDDNESEAKRIADMINSGKFMTDLVRMNDHIHRHVSNYLNDPEWARKHLYDFFTDPDFIQLHRPRLVEWTRTQSRTGGIWPGPYLEAVYACVWFNQQLGDQINFHPSFPQLTCDELLEAAEKLHRYNQTAPEKIGLFGLCDRSTSTYRLFQRLYVSCLVDEKGELLPPEKTVNREEAVLEVLRFFEQLAKYDLFFRTTGNKHSNQSLFTQEKVLFYFSYSDRFFAMKQKNGAEWMQRALLLESPTLHPVNFAYGSFEHSWAVMKNSPNSDIAIDFLKHIAVAHTLSEASEGSVSRSGLRGSFFEAAKQNVSPFNAYTEYMINRYQDNIHKAYVEAARRLPALDYDNIYDAIMLHDLLYDMLLNKTPAQEAFDRVYPRRFPRIH
jgi:disulfide oxidoreductase YuzD